MIGAKLTPAKVAADIRNLLKTGIHPGIKRRNRSNLADSPETPLFV
jgi:hypothetical protein